MMVPEVRPIEKPHVAHQEPQYHAPVTHVKDTVHGAREIAHVATTPNPDEPHHVTGHPSAPVYH